MNRLLFCLILFSTYTTSLFAQNKNLVTGLVFDSQDKSPVGQATVQILSLPDSTMVTGNITDNDGLFKLSVKPGKYALKVSFIGYTTHVSSLQVGNKDVNIGKIALKTDVVLLKEAVVTAQAPEVTVTEDTVAFNATAFRTSKGAMLEELIKKIPGADIDDDGKITINGKEVKKLMVNGKEFFGGDIQTGMKNLPVDMIDKLKTYDKKSDLARVTGIDDGEEETVLDIGVKKGMNKGWFGNADLAGGTEKRYSGKAMTNYFNDNNQFSLIASGNNVNDKSFSSGASRWRNNNGLYANKMIGANFAIETKKLELDGSARYNYSDADIQKKGQIENILPNGNSYVNSNNLNRNKDKSAYANLRLEWRPDSMTNIIFRPNFSWGDSYNYSHSKSGTFNSDPYEIVDNPNEYLSLAEGSLTNSELDKIRLNLSNNNRISNGNNISANGNLQVNRKLNTKGRNITLRTHFSYGDNTNDQFTNNFINYFSDGIITNRDSIRRFIQTPTNNYTIGSQLTYSEPIAKAVFLQFSYRFNYRYNESDKSTYNLPFEWSIGQPLPGNFEDNKASMKDESQSKYAEYKNFNHDGMISLRFIRPKWQLSSGLSFQPQHTIMSYKKDNFEVDTTRNVFNFAPNIDFRYRFSKISQLRFTYRGRSSQPSMEKLLPITDDSNPLNIIKGNPGLNPSFTHNAALFYNKYNKEKQRGIFTHWNASMIQNAVSNSRIFNEATGGWTSTPKNINGNWNIFGLIAFNSALKNKKFTVNTFTITRYNNNVGYLTDNKTKIEQKNTTTNLFIKERLRGTFRNDWLEFGINGSFGINFEKDKLTPSNNQKPFSFEYGATTTLTTPWGTSLSTNITDQSRRGYSDTSMNVDELIWNAQISQSFFKGAATLSFEVFDILKQQSNFSRSYNATGRSVYTYNGINHYCMVHFIYNFNIFGDKNARNKMGKYGNNRHSGGYRSGYGRYGGRKSY